VDPYFQSFRFTWATFFRGRVRGYFANVTLHGRVYEPLLSTRSVTYTSNGHSFMSLQSRKFWSRLYVTPPPLSFLSLVLFISYDEGANRLPIQLEFLTTRHMENRILHMSTQISYPPRSDLGPRHLRAQYSSILPIAKRVHATLAISPLLVRE